MLGHQPLGLGNAFINSMRCELLKTLVKHALPAVERNYARIRRNSVEHGERAG